MLEPVADLTIDLPPLLNGRPVVPPERPRDAALRAVQAGDAEAGDLFWSCDPDVIALTLALEPEVSPDRAREMLFALMVASADAIGALGPPELAFTWTWPDRFYANGAAVGWAFLDMSEDLDEAGAPVWLLVGLEVRLKPYPDADPGNAPDRTSLWDEGAGDLVAPQVVEGLSRHMSSWINRWEGDGFKPVHDAWLFRCAVYKKTALQVPPQAQGAAQGVAVGQEIGQAQELDQGQMLGLDEHGNCLFQPIRDAGQGAPELLPLTDYLRSGGYLQPMAGPTAPRPESD